jgi:micrococcal nuclease
VFEVIDGDTIGVRIEGQSFRVRYIGIDTPEIVHPGIPVEPFGPEAAEANRSLVLGQRVMLERDVSDTDTYGRLLRYVWLGDTLVNAELVRLGLAQSNHYEPDVLYQDRLDALESQARAAGLGIWSITPTPPLPPAERSQPGGVFIAEVIKPGKPETVTLTNGGAGPVDLSGWTLVSVRGNQRYGFPGGTVLDPGASLTIFSGPGADTAGPLYWTTDNVWNNSEFDPAELYDASGGLVDRWEG